ncbi:hypothetical protein [Zavarzinia sp.]|uniref:hypothetical protein n=1 Tax=Zavarzinia sp. TaxID=2027920 RepID=UPI0035681139
MSLVALGREHAASRLPPPNFNFTTLVTKGLPGVPPPPPPAAATVPGADSALDALTKYIPVETVTLYVAAVSAQPALQSMVSWATAGLLYVIFGVLTPVILWLVAARAQRAAGLTPTLPLWRMFAATVAYFVWGLSVPGLIEGDAARVVAAFGAVLVSTLLSLVEGVLPKPQ